MNERTDVQSRRISSSFAHFCCSVTYGEISRTHNIKGQCTGLATMYVVPFCIISLLALCLIPIPSSYDVPICQGVLEITSLEGIYLAFQVCQTLLWAMGRGYFPNNAHHTQWVYFDLYGCISTEINDLHSVRFFSLRARPVLLSCRAERWTF